MSVLSLVVWDCNYVNTFLNDSIEVNCLIGLFSFVFPSPLYLARKGQSSTMHPTRRGQLHLLLSGQPQSCFLLCYILLLLILNVKNSPYKKGSNRRHIDEHGDLSSYYTAILLHHDKGTLSKYSLGL
jgi:hypothetical protein